MQGLVVMPLFAGYDHEKGRGRIYKFDVTGGRFAETDYYATGSGGKDARSSLKKTFHPHAFSRDQAVSAAVEALMDAADEDTGTGGFDLVRKIYPTCKVITSDGVEDVPAEQLVQAREAVLEQRRES